MLTHLALSWRWPCDHKTLWNSCDGSGSSTQCFSLCFTESVLFAHGKGHESVPFHLVTETLLLLPVQPRNVSSSANCWGVSCATTSEVPRNEGTWTLLLKLFMPSVSSIPGIT